MMELRKKVFSSRSLALFWGVTLFGTVALLLIALTVPSISDNLRDSRPLLLREEEYFGLDNTSLIIPKLVYFPRIPKTGSTTVFDRFYVWLSRYANFLGDKMIDEFADKLKVAKKKKSKKKKGAKNADEKRLFAKLLRKSAWKTSRFAWVKCMRGFWSHLLFHSMQNPGFAEANDGCKHTGGNSQIEKRTVSFKRDFSEAWNILQSRVQALDSAMTDTLFAATARRCAAVGSAEYCRLIQVLEQSNAEIGIGTNTRQPTFDNETLYTYLTQAQKRQVIREVYASANSSEPFAVRQLPVVFFAHFPFLVEMDSWMRAQIAPFLMQNVVFFREAVSRQVSNFHFIRKPTGMFQQRAASVWRLTDNYSLLQCAQELQRQLAEYFPFERAVAGKCKLAVNFQLKWMCGSLQLAECGCADGFNQTQVALAKQRTNDYFDFVGFVDTMTADLRKLRKVLFDLRLIEDSKALQSILPISAKKALNRVPYNNTADDLEAIQLLTEINRFENMFIEELRNSRL